MTPSRIPSFRHAAVDKSGPPLLTLKPPTELLTLFSEHTVVCPSCDSWNHNGDGTLCPKGRAVILRMRAYLLRGAA